MEAKDTVTLENPYNSHSEEQAERLVWMSYEEGKTAQAPISFKAGADEEAKRGIERCSITYDEGRKTGIKEVVGDIQKAMDNAKVGHILGAVELCLIKWQAKLKEWGIE